MCVKGNSRMPRDDASVTVRLDSAASGKSLNQKKLDQLAQARIKSLEVHRRTQNKAKLEAKLNAIRSMLGPDMRADTIERVAKEMVAREEKHSAEVARLREKQMQATEELQTTMSAMRDEISRMRKVIAGQTTQNRPAGTAPRVKSLSEVGSHISSVASSRRT